MGQLFTLGAEGNKCIHYDECPMFNHGMISSTVANQNPYDFGFLYYVKNPMGGAVKKNYLVGTCIYDFDHIYYVGKQNDKLFYLGDDFFAQYKFDSSGTYKSYGNYGSYKLFNSEKLMHSDDEDYLSLNPIATIHNDSGSWYSFYNSMNSSRNIGGGFNISYRKPNSDPDNIYVYLINHALDTSYFRIYDLTDSDVLCYDHKAVKYNILRAYDMGDCYNYRSTDGFVYISIIFNNIGTNSTSGEYSLRYGFDTWIYIYSSGGGFQGKTVNVQKYNYNNQSTPISTTYTFDHEDDNTRDHNIGYNVIGLPVFDWSSSYIVNYYDINIS